MAAEGKALGIRMHRIYRPLIRWDWPERYLILTGGRGSGKSFASSLALSMVMRNAGYRTLYTRYTLTSAEDSIVPEFLGKCELAGMRHEFDPVGANISHIESGSDLLFRGIKTSSGNQTAKLKSLTGVNVWMLDEADELDDEKTFDTINLSVRDKRRPNKVILAFNPSHVSHWLYKRFWLPYRLPEGFSGVSPAGVRHIHTDYRNNLENLPPDFIAEAERMKAVNPGLYSHIFLGHWASEIDGALWTWETISRNRVTPDQVPALVRIVVAVDPAAKSKASSDLTGIIVVGLGTDGHYYVLDDGTLRGSPLAWARQVVAKYEQWRADLVVGEDNNGGEMVEATLRQVDANLPYQSVNASRGKIVRAQPVSSLYERNLVHHVGTFTKLEEEQTTYTGDPSEPSPNRLDAVVWGITELMGKAGSRGMRAADRMTS